VLKTITGVVFKLKPPLTIKLLLLLHQMTRRPLFNLLLLRPVPLPLIQFTTNPESNHHIQKPRITVVPGLLLTTFVVPSTVIMLTLLKVVVTVVVTVLLIVRSLTVSPVDQVTVDSISTIFQMNSITLVPLTLV